MSSHFFESNNYFIDEKVNYFKFENCYKVFDENGVQIGSVKQKLSGGQKVLRLLLNKSMLPFRLEIRDANEQLLVSVTRGWTFFMSKISILDPQENPIGSITQKFKLLKPSFRIFSNAGAQIGEIQGDWKAWNFVINDASGTQIGTISKKWAGAMKEIFTSADKYHVSVDPSYANLAGKTILLASAITIDMVLKESKQ